MQEEPSAFPLPMHPDSSTPPPEPTSPIRLRRPRSYEGDDHETIGSDLLSVLAVVSDPSEVLGKTYSARLAKVTPDGWYPISWLLELLDLLDERVGQMGLRQM